MIYGTFADGTYTGTATGFGNGLTVEVVIQDNLIRSIEITDHNERQARFYQKAFDAVPLEILQSQSLEVDTMTGATFSSIGILNAVHDVISQALIEGELPAQKALPANRRH